MFELIIVLSVLGLIQGVTEFLPVSSSGHLTIFQSIPPFRGILENTGDDVFMLINIALHFATLIAIILYLRKDVVKLFKGFFVSLWKRDFSDAYFWLALYILAASVPVAIIGILFKSDFEILFGSMLPVGFFLLLNAAILIASKKIPIRSIEMEKIGLKRAFAVGVFQVLALFPGISRAGTTISAGLLFGLKPEVAARFSFLLVIPAIGGATLLEILEVGSRSLPSRFWFALTIATVLTTIVGYYSMQLLFYFVKKIKLDYFGYYTAAVGLAIIVTQLVR